VCSYEGKEEKGVGRLRDKGGEDEGWMGGEEVRKECVEEDGGVRVAGKLWGEANGKGGTGGKEWGG